MSSQFQSSYRCYLIDHHSPQPPAVTLENIDIAAYERFVQEAHVDSQMVYCKDHWGVTYYPSATKGAQMHAGIKGDWIAQVRDMLAKNSIEFVAYYCIEYDEGAARRFPEWRVRKADGTPLIRDDAYAKWSLCCYQTGYRAYCLSQLREIVTGYHPDALFMDIFGASLCYCDACRESFRQRYGYELPETQAGLLVHQADVCEFLDGNASAFLDDVRDALHAIDPTLAITINFACHYPASIRDKLDYQFSEPLLRDNWFSSAYARDTAVGQYPILAPGEASQVYNYSPASQYIYDLSCIAAQGCRVGMYSGSQHKDGTLDFEEARRLGTAYRVLDAFRPWTVDRSPVRCAGILQSDASTGTALERFEPDAILRAKVHNPHVNAILGAMELCETAKIPWRVLPTHSLTPKDLEGYELLLLPELYAISEGLRSTLEAYVKNGGRLVLSACTGLCNAGNGPGENFALSGLMGADFVSRHDEYKANDWSAYLSPVSGSVFEDAASIFSRTTPPVSEFFVDTHPRGAKTLLEFCVPCVEVTPSQWVNWWSPPPGHKTGIPALLWNKVGSGHVFYCAFDLFTMASKETYQALDELFARLLSLSGVKPLIRNETPLPHILRTAFYERQGAQGKELIVHQISSMARLAHGETPTVNGGKLCVDSARFPVKKAEVVFPQHRELTVENYEDRAEIALPDLDMQQIIVLQ